MFDPSGVHVHSVEGIQNHDPLGIGVSPIDGGIWVAGMPKLLLFVGANDHFGYNRMAPKKRSRNTPRSAPELKKVKLIIIYLILQQHALVLNSTLLPNNLIKSHQMKAKK